MPMTAAGMVMITYKPLVVTPFIMIMAVATVLVLAIGLGILFGGMIDSAKEMEEFNKKIGFTKETEAFIREQGLDK
jgi:hypothetical protein